MTCIAQISNLYSQNTRVFIDSKNGDIIMDKEIEGFTQSIGAFAPTPQHESYSIFQSLFGRHSNYFILYKKLLIIKISRNSRPFWGVRKRILEVGEILKDEEILKGYFLVLLNSEKVGWLCSEIQIEENIKKKKKWKLNEKDHNYKINAYTLRDIDRFSSIESFRKKFRI